MSAVEAKPAASDKTASAETGHAGQFVNGRRKRLVGGVLLVFLLAGAGYGVWWHFIGRYTEFTDDAYVVGHIVQVTPQVAGSVTAVTAEDTEFVKAGQTLVELDKAESRVALDSAEAQLARTVREVRNLMASTAGLEAAITQRRTELAKAREDLVRRERITESGAVSAEEIGHARDALAGAQAALVTTEQALAAHRTLIDRTSVASHPNVLAAAARVREVYLSYARTSLPAPVSGYVAKRNVQVGQRVAPGAVLMTVVPLEQVWVDANFKERQLTPLRIGQPVKLRADLYGSDVEYHGKVAGFSAGTGSAFALLPPQNASGNWIKIVQRVPVRIALDPAELAAHPLQLGLSMHVEVDTHQRDGERLPKTGRKQDGTTPDSTGSTAASPMDTLAAQRVAAIIAAHGGVDGTATATPPAEQGKR